MKKRKKKEKRKGKRGKSEKSETEAPAPRRRIMRDGMTDATRFVNVENTESFSNFNKIILFYFELFSDSAFLITLSFFLFELFYVEHGIWNFSSGGRDFLIKFF